MAKLWVVFRREYLERVRSKWFLLGTLLGPVFFILVAGAPRLIGNRGEGTRDVAHIEVIDATGAGLGERVAAALRDRFPLSRAPYLTVVDESTAMHPGPGSRSSDSNASTFLPAMGASPRISTSPPIRVIARAKRAVSNTATRPGVSSSST